MNITYREINELSKILGKTKIAVLGTDLFLPLVELKLTFSKLLKNYQELQIDLYRETGIKFNIDGSVPANTPVDVLNQMSFALKKLEQEVVELPDMYIISPELFQNFSEENHQLILAELELIYKYLVIQN